MGEHVHCVCNTEAHDVQGEGLLFQVALELGFVAGAERFGEEAGGFGWDLGGLRYGVRDQHVVGDDEVVGGGLVMCPPVGKGDGALGDHCGVDR